MKFRNYGYSKKKSRNQVTSRSMLPMYTQIMVISNYSGCTGCYTKNRIYDFLKIMGNHKYSLCNGNSLVTHKIPDQAVTPIQDPAITQMHVIAVLNGCTVRFWVNSPGQRSQPGRRVHPQKRSVSWVNSVLRQFLPHGLTAKGRYFLNNPAQSVHLINRK